MKNTIMMNFKIDAARIPTQLMRDGRKLIVSLSVATMLLGSGIQDALANGAINFVSGKVQVLNAAGDPRAASKGDRVVPGEVLATGADGEIHVIMDDNALIALRPNSRLKIDAYVAEGNEKDSALFSLIRGQLRSVTGWIGKIAPKNYAIRTPSATIGIRGTDHEVAVIDSGDDAGTFDKVNTGETVLQTTFGEVSVQPGRAGFAGKTSTERPALLAAVPAFYKPTPNEQLINQTKKLLEQSIDQRLKKKHDEQVRQGGVNEQGNTKISDSCGQDPAALQSFNDFIRAYELGNTALIRNKLDPSMLGYLRFIEGVNQDSNRFKQIRLTLKDTQLQCGPDVTVIQTLWEKRFLDVTTFAPGIFTGRATILMHRNDGDWKFVAVTGDNPFSSQSGVLAQLNFGPIGSSSAASSFGARSDRMDAAPQMFSIAGVTSTPSLLPLNIEVIDPDLVGKGTLQVQIVTNQGDAENVDLFETTPGRFARSSFYFSSNAPIPGNNVLEVGAGAILSLRYIDQNPGDNRPPALLTRNLLSTGAPLASVKNSAPDPFSFAAPAAQPPNTPVGSNTVTITGNTAPAPVSIIGGTYSINGSPFTSAPGTVSSGQTITVQTTSSPIPGGTANATLNVGGVVAIFSVVTLNPSASTTPNPFAFSSPAPQPPNTSVTSNTVTITGNSAASPVSITGGSYSIDGGSFTSAPGSIVSGQSVAVRTTSSPIAGATVTATLNIGGVTGSYSVTTQAAPTSTPNPFNFVSPGPQLPNTTVSSNTVFITGNTLPAAISISGGSYAIDGGAFTTAPGTINSGQSVVVRVVSSATAGGSVAATLTVGGLSATFTVTTQTVASTSPNPFSFTTPPPQLPNVSVTSNTVTITGNNVPAAVTITGGTYSIDGGAFTSAPGTIDSGHTVTVRTTSSATAGGVVTATLSVASVSASFTVTTQAATSSIPNPFSFTSPTPQPPNTSVTSNTVTISGNTSPSAVSITGGSYSIDGGAFTSTAGTISSGHTVAVRVTSSATAGGTVVATLTIGGVSGTFTVTTQAANSPIPNPFSFTSLTQQGLNTVVTSNTVTITGNTAPAPVSISGGTYSINGGTFTSSAGTILAGQTIRVGTTTSASPATSVVVTLTIGGVAGTFTATTVDTVPDPFSFPSLTAQPTLTSVTSSRATITGIDSPSPISVVGGTYSINGGAFTGTPGTITNGQSVALNLVTARAQNTPATATLNIGGVTGSFTATTWNLTPNPYSFNTATAVHPVGGAVPLPCSATSNTVSITGINGPAPVSISGPSPAAAYSINGGAFTAAPGTISNGNTVAVKGTVNYNRAIPGPQASATLNVGGVSATFSIICM